VTNFYLTFVARKEPARASENVDRMRSSGRWSCRPFIWIIPERRRSMDHATMVASALDPEQAFLKYDEEMTNQDIQAYIYMEFGEKVTTGEISDLRHALEHPDDFVGRQI
jgi:hypothetical protein